MPSGAAPVHKHHKLKQDAEKLVGIGVWGCELRRLRLRAEITCRYGYTNMHVQASIQGWAATPVLKQSADFMTQLLDDEKM